MAAYTNDYVYSRKTLSATGHYAPSYDPAATNDLETAIADYFDAGANPWRCCANNHQQCITFKLPLTAEEKADLDKAHNDWNPEPAP